LNSEKYKYLEEIFQKMRFIKTKKDMDRLWIALLLACFAWVPLINFAFLFGSFYLTIKQLMLIKKRPEKYGGKVIAIIWLIGFMVLLILSIRGLIISFSQ
jgi:hypothetical protein